MPLPFISVIIATYNSIATLPRAMDSVFNQTHKEIELIVIDDGSTDATYQYLASRKEPFRFYRQINQGPASARNRGLRVAQGDYVMFLDADDYIASEKLSKQLKVFEVHPNHGWVYCDVAYVDQKDRYLYPASERFLYSERSTLEGDLFKELFTGNFIPIHAPLIHRNTLHAIGYFDEDPRLIGVEDWDLLLRLSLCAKAAYIPEALATCVIHPSSLSSDPVARDTRRYYLLDKAITRFPESIDRLGLKGKKLSADVHNWFGYYYYAEGQSKNACNRFWRSLCDFPFQKKAWFYFILTLFQIRVSHK